MKRDSFDSSTTSKTFDTIAFTDCGPNSQALFRVNPDIPIESALEHASNRLTCINDLSLDAALGDAGKQSVWAVHYLSDMARAIVESVLADKAIGMGLRIQAAIAGVRRYRCLALLVSSYRFL